MRLEFFVMPLISTSLMIQRVEGLSVPNTKELSSCNISRRNYLGLLTPAAAFAATILPSKTLAFDGSGSSAYAGRSPATKAELKRISVKTGRYIGLKELAKKEEQSEDRRSLVASALHSCVDDDDDDYLESSFQRFAKI